MMVMGELASLHQVMGRVVITLKGGRKEKEGGGGVNVCSQIRDSCRDTICVVLTCLMTLLFGSSLSWAISKTPVWSAKYPASLFKV